MFNKINQLITGHIEIKGNIDLRSYTLKLLVKIKKFHHVLQS